MKKIRYILLISLIFRALSVFSQQGLCFDSLQWNFGVIEESGGPVSCSFRGKNRGTKPEVILHVAASCGCTRPVYSRKPILPGESFQVEVSYDPLGRPGPFDRALTVYDAARNEVAKLRITGHVNPRKRTVEEIYPVAAAGGVRLTNNFLPMGAIAQDGTLRMTVRVVNTSNQPRRLHFASLSQSGFLTLEAPSRLAPGEEAEVVVSGRIPHASGYYGTLRDAYELQIEGFSERLPFTCEGVVVDAPERAIGDLGSAEVQLPTNIRMGERRQAGNLESEPFTLTNAGEEPLVIRAVECSPGFACSLRTGDRVMPHHSRQAEVSLSPRNFDYGVTVGRILLVTNDPDHPVRHIRVSAILIE